MHRRLVVLALALCGTAFSQTDPHNRRYSTLTGITPANIASLAGAWTFHVAGGAANANLEATPVVVDGVMYLPGSPGTILALDAATGELKWKYKPQPGGPRGGTNRGVAVGEGKVFSTGGGNTLIALDQKTGQLLWTAKVGDRGTTVAPALYYDGLVYMGTSGGEGGIRGFFGAFDAKDGKQVWGFWTIPGPGEKGHETWEGDSWKRGGGPVWTRSAIDPQLGMIYVPVGNAWPDMDGTKRGGDNLYTASVVALDLKTGACRWHFQEVHHDLWDYDNAASPVLADVIYQGRPRKILIHAGKTGFTYILDRTNGKPLVGIEEKPVPQEARMKTAKTQPYPVGDSFVPTCPEPDSVAPGLRTACVFGAYWDEPVVMAPGTLGGISWASMTFSPRTGLVYVPGAVTNSLFTLRGGFVRPANEPRSGTLTAIDPTSNKIVWQKRMKFPIAAGSGLLSTATGLLFHGEPDGRLVAYDIKSGNELWSFQTGAGADAPAITYEVKGQQYVAIIAGGSSFNLSQHGDTLWAFKLGGTIPPAPAPIEPPLRQPAPAAREGPGARGR
jgi:PQQ-dependent dehydrogenase (methanol/ethanol family)